MKMLMLVCVLVLMASASVTADSSQRKASSRAYLETLAPVYARYVVCYSCGSRFDKSKKQCDDTVRDLAQRACKRVDCSFTLDERLKSLRKLLTLKYQTEARRWCGAKWVKKYI